MDLDAVITFKRVLKEDTISIADKMLLSSAINNKNIDINLSITENLNLINKDGISLEELFLYLKEFIGDKELYTDVPIYMLFLEKRDLWDLLLNAYKKNDLDEKSVLYIGENIFKYLDVKDSKNIDDLVSFFNSLLSIRKPENYELFQNSFSFEPFIYANIDDIYTGSNSVNKSLLITLISFGYISLDLLNNSIDDSYSYIEIFFKELLNRELYTYIKIFINSRTVSKDLAIIIKDIINEYASCDEKNQRLEHFLNTINSKLDDIIFDKKVINRH